MITINSSKEKLVKHNIKPSVQRLAVLNYLENHPTHPTVDTIFQDLSPEIPTLSKTTIYNTLTLLLENDVIQAINIEEKNVRYDGNKEAHVHFLCTKCHKIYDYPMANIVMPDGVGECDVENVQIYYRGICKHCKTK